MTVPVLGWGSNNPESLLVTDTIPGTKSFMELWEECCPQPETRLNFIHNLGSFLKSMADGGILHFDFHPGNILGSTFYEKKWFFLVDFSNINFQRSKNLRQQYLLISWLQNFLLKLSSREQFFLLNSVGLCESMADLDHARRGIIKCNQQKGYDLWPGRKNYFLGQSKKCEIGVSDMGKWILLRPFDLEKATEIVKGYPGQPNRSGIQGSIDTGSEEHSVDQRRHFSVKEFKASGIFFRFSVARRFWLRSHRLQLHGIPVPRVYAWLMASSGLSYVITENLSEKNLFQELSSREKSAREFLLLKLAKVLAEIHNLRFQFIPLTTRNFFIKEDQNHPLELVIYTQLENLKIGIKTNLEAQTFTLKQIFESLPTTVGSTEKIRFLIAYRRSTFTSKDDIKEIIRRLVK